MTEMKCLTEQDLTLLYYGEAPDSMDLLAAHRHLKSCPECRQRQQQLNRDMRSLPQSEYPLDPYYAARLAARLAERVPRRRIALPAVAGGLAAAVVVFSFTFWKPGPQLPMHNTAIQPSKVAETTPAPDIDMLENLDLLRELDTLSELTGV